MSLPPPDVGLTCTPVGDLKGVAKPKSTKKTLPKLTWNVNFNQSSVVMLKDLPRSLVLRPTTMLSLSAASVGQMGSIEAGYS